MAVCPLKFWNNSNFIIKKNTFLKIISGYSTHAYKVSGNGIKQHKLVCTLTSLESAEERHP